MEEERVYISGKKEDVYSELEEKLGLCPEDAVKFLNFLEAEKEILGEDEEFHKTEEVDGIHGMLGFMTMDYNYYINLTAATVFAISCLIDATIKAPLTATFLAVRGIKPLRQPIDEQPGMKCILCELLHSKGRQGDAKILERFHGECCNNNMTCFYRNDSICGCTEDRVKLLLEKMVSLGILKSENGIYIYDPIGTL